jgi:hypothetical protein
MSDGELPTISPMSNKSENVKKEEHNDVFVIDNKTFVTRSIKIKVGEVIEPIDRPRSMPLVYVGTYNPEQGVSHQKLTDDEDWCRRMQQVLIAMGIVSCVRLDPCGVNYTGCRMSLELFVQEGTLTLPYEEHQYEKGIFIGPALAGWVETLSLPPEIKKEACAMLRHVKNQTVTSCDTGDPRVDTMKQFLTLLQHMYKVKMSGKSLEGLKTLIPIFLLLANKL